MHLMQQPDASLRLLILLVSAVGRLAGIAEIAQDFRPARGDTPKIAGRPADILTQPGQQRSAFPGPG